MNSFTVASLGSAAASVLLSRRILEGRIHSVFRSALNLVADQDLVSIVPYDSQRGPLNLVLSFRNPVHDLTLLGLRPGDGFETSNSALTFDERVCFSFESAKVYTCPDRVPARLLDPEAIAENLKLAVKIGLERGSREGIGALLGSLLPEVDDVSGASPNVYAKVARIQFQKLLRALMSQKEPDVTESVRNLIGLGPGLTPSADDALAGFSIMLGIYSRSSGRLARQCEVFRMQLNREVVGRTSRISEAFLRQAANGQGGEAVVDLCVSLLSGDGPAISRATERTLSIGSSSGTDTLVGVVLAGTMCTRHAPVISEGVEEK